MISQIFITKPNCTIVCTKLLLHTQKALSLFLPEALSNFKSQFHALILSDHIANQLIYFQCWIFSQFSFKSHGTRERELERNYFHFHFSLKQTLGRSLNLPQSHDFNVFCDDVLTSSSCKASKPKSVSNKNFPLRLLAKSSLK